MSEKEGKTGFPDRVVYLSPDQIMIPEVRVTSVVDKELYEELKESIKQRGILEPIAVAEVDGKYVLIDGLHRLLVAKELGIKKVPCLIKKLPLDQVLIENLIRARQRGHSDPAGEAEVIKTLVEEYRYKLTDVAKMMGMSVTRARKLYAISKLPEDIKAYLRYRKLPLEGAYLLTFLKNPEDQREIAELAVKYGYTVEQIKAAVTYKLRPETPEEEVGWTFTPEGIPQRVLPTCFLCGKEIEGEAKYVWLHDECLKILQEAIEYERQLSRQEQQQPQPQPPQPQQPQKPQKPQSYWPY